MKNRILLKEWLFNIGETQACLETGASVTVPHTWNVEAGREEYWGDAWYQHQLNVPMDWDKKRVRLMFHAVYHTADVYVNGHLVGSHSQSGYTAFTMEITDCLEPGQVNTLLVKVNNAFSEDMLPYMRSFDWANDGGLIRDVEVLVSGEAYMDQAYVDAEPIIVTEGKRQMSGSGVFGAHFQVALGQAQSYEVAWTLSKGCDGDLSFVRAGVESVVGGYACIGKVIMKHLAYWHFDQPNLYTLKASLVADGVVVDTKEIVFGFRRFETRGSAFYLNGEPVRVCGTEWMPGSHPDFGSAETKEELEKMLVLLKESNCIYTRFHWQQDPFIYDWCDRHGMMIQEEVPFWGKGIEDEETGDKQLEIYKKQLGEMLTLHRNHPSIIAWGVGNELYAQSPNTLQYIKDAVAYTHAVDPSRLANYVSNTFFEDPALDGCTDGDVMMINDYIGTWHGPLDQYGELEKIITMNPDKPVVSAEFGLCEPAFSGGDERRTEIFLEKMVAYRHFDAVAGIINFCLNDYRTQMGEDGHGKFRQRIHGSTDLYGKKKGSYEVVQRECAPFVYTLEGSSLVLTCREDLPRYAMVGYYGKVFNGDSVVVEQFAIDDMEPGDGFRYDVIFGGKGHVGVYRASGDLVMEIGLDR